MIKPPPANLELSSAFFALPPEYRFWKHSAEYLALHKPLDDQGRYLPFDQLRRRWPSHLDPMICWAFVKSARIGQQSRILPVGNEHGPTWVLTPVAQKAISNVDRNATTAALDYMTSKIGETAHFHYLLNDLIEDEAISSSQLEGASTTTRVAKDMLKRHRLPRTPDERMIMGNFKMMQFAWEKRHEALSVELIEGLHRIGVVGIDDDMYSPGVLRINDDVVVQDGEGNVVHVPPAARDLKARLERLAGWINQSHNDHEALDYLHPLIKGIALHFALGYEHPFRDGNGRVARALFYWFMFKNDFSVFRYIAISVLLRNAPVKYGRAYLYSETDDMDITYFIDHQCSVIVRAVDDFQSAYRKIVTDVQGFDQWLVTSGLYEQLSEKQRALFQVALNGVGKEFTAVNVKDNLGCSYNTASAVLNGLVELGLFDKTKMGREWVFCLRDQAEIKKRWSD